MPRIPGLQRRKGGRYYFRIRVPEDLRERFDGRREIVKSLGTTDYGEARRLVSIERARAETDFAEARRSVSDRRNIQSSRADIEQAVWSWFVDQATTEWQAFQNATDVEEATAKENVRVDHARLTDFNDDQSNAAIDRIVRDIIQERSLLVDETSALFAEFRLKVRRGMLEHGKRWESWFAGDFSHRSHDPAFAEPPAASGNQLSLEQLTEAFLADPALADRSPKKALEYRLAFLALNEVVGGDRDVSEISRDHCRQVRDLLSRLPPNAAKRFPRASLREAAALADRAELARLSRTTVNGYLTKIARLFRWAVQERHMRDNPAEALQLDIRRRSARDLRNPFSSDQLQRIFSAPLYTGCKDDERGYATVGENVIRRTKFWVPLISLYSGMRLNEICQLHIADIVEFQGISCFSIDDRTGGTEEPKRLKSSAARRIVPVHSELLRIGFREFVAERKLHGSVRLFPDLRRDGRGYYSDGFQKWFSRFIAKAGAKVERTSFHSFRHSFRDAMRVADIREEVAKALGGWADQNSASNYGRGFEAPQLNKALQSVKYPSLDLSGLYI